IEDDQMTRRIIFAVSAIAIFMAATVVAQGPQAPPQRGAPAPHVSFQRILKQNEEPQKWLTYAGSLTSQRYSSLNEITTANAKDLELKWVFQSRSLEK